jgi:hypothetical protein
VEVSKGHGEAADELDVGEKMGRAQQVGRSGQCGIWDGIGLGAQQHTELLAQDAVVCSDARQEKGGGGSGGGRSQTWWCTLSGQGKPDRRARLKILIISKSQTVRT